MKQKVAVLLTIFVTFAFLFSVGYCDEKVEITYLTRNRAEEYGRETYDFFAKKFEELNPNVKISFIDTTYDQQLNELLLRGQAGTPPDVSDPVASWLPTLVEAELLEPIGDLVSQEHIQNFPAGMINDGTFNNKIYSLPLWSGPITLFMNKDLSERAGIGLNSPEDILQFQEMVEKISSLGKDEEGQDIYGFSLRNVKTGNSALWFMPWLWSWGGKLVDEYNKPVLDSIGTRKALEFYHWLTDNGHSARGQDIYPTRITFSQGRAGFILDGPWLRGMLRTITEDPSIDEMYIPILFPKGWDGTRWSISNYSGGVVFSGSKNKEVASKFIEFITSDEEVVRMVYEDMGSTPAILTAYEKDWAQDEYLKPFIQQNYYARAVPWKDHRWPAVQEIIANALTQAIDGQDINNIVLSAQKEFEEILSD